MVRVALRHRALHGHAATSLRNGIAGVGTQESGDKTPYKTHQGAFVAAGPATGWYVEIAPQGMRVGAGYYEAAGPRLAAVRDAVADDKTGPALERILSKLEKVGFEISGERLKTTPRGYDADHPRIELLRHKQLLAGKPYGFADYIHTPGLVDQVRADWRALKPLVAWLERAFAAAD